MGTWCMHMISAEAREGIGTLEAGVPGSCSPSHMGAQTRLGFSEGAVNTLSPLSLLSSFHVDAFNVN